MLLELLAILAEFFDLPFLRAKAPVTVTEKHWQHDRRRTQGGPIR